MTRFAATSRNRQSGGLGPGPGRSHRCLTRLLAVPLVLTVSALTASATAATLSPIAVKTAPAPVSLWSPAADGPWFGWVRSPDDIQYNYFVQKRGDPPIRVNAVGTRADGGGIDGHTLVYSQQRQRGSGADLYSFDLRSGQRTALPAPVNTRHSTSATRPRTLTGKRFGSRSSTGAPDPRSAMTCSSVV